MRKQCEDGGRRIDGRLETGDGRQGTEDRRGTEMRTGDRRRESGDGGWEMEDGRQETGCTSFNDWRCTS